MIPCKDCNFKTEDKCWHYGKMSLGERSKKVVWGCEKYRPWWTMQPQ